MRALAPPALAALADHRGRARRRDLPRAGARRLRAGAAAARAVSPSSGGAGCERRRRGDRSGGPRAHRADARGQGRARDGRASSPPRSAPTSATRPDPTGHAAARIAAKEAVYKAMQSLPGARAIGWRDIEVTRDSGGPPGDPAARPGGAARGGGGGRDDPGVAHPLGAVGGGGRGGQRAVQPKRSVKRKREAERCDDERDTHRFTLHS